MTSPNGTHTRLKTLSDSCLQIRIERLALGGVSPAHAPRARSGTRPSLPAPQSSNFLSPRSFPTPCRHDGTASPPYPRRYPSVVPLQSLQRHGGGVTVRLRRGQAQDQERRKRARLSERLPTDAAIGSRNEWFGSLKVFVRLHRNL